MKELWGAAKAGWKVGVGRLGMLLFIATALTACLQPPGGGAVKAGSQATAVKRPNILYILADDLGYADLGVFGSEIPTPNLDALAKQGMLLTDFYAGMTCSPTRSMLMSGTDNHQAGLGVMGVPTRADQKGKPGYEGYLNFRIASLAELMTDAGYNTYMVGKWHLGDTVETGPHARGFRRVFASFDGAAHLGGWDWRGPTPAKYWDDDQVVNVGDDWYTTRDYTRKMLGYIEQDRTEASPSSLTWPIPRRIGRCRRRRPRSRSSRAGTTPVMKRCTRSASRGRSGSVSCPGVPCRSTTRASIHAGTL